MSQNDFNIANQGFPATRADINSALQALASNSAGTAEPSTTYAYQFWYDETNELLKMRNSDNDAWITLAAFDQTNDEWEVRSAVIQAVDAAGVTIKTDDGTARITVADNGNVTIANNLTVTGTVSGSNISATGALSNRNKILNGAMVIDQRNGGASVTPTSDDTYTLDRWKARLSASSKFSVEQSSTAPTGFTKSILVTSLAATSLGASDYYTIQQNVEGYNIADLNWGTAAAQDVTLSFWVRSSLAGTFGGAFTNNAYNRTYLFSYSISSADTWEKKTITVAGDTSGTWLATNGLGVQIVFSLGMGSTYSGTAGSWSGSTLLSVTGATSVVGTNGATFYLTGVQLEVGDTATPFEHRSYGQELALCQRYCQVSGGEQSTQLVMSGVGNGTSITSQILKPYVKFRTLPTLSLSAASDFAFLQYSPFVSGAATSASIITANSSSDYIYIDWNISGGTSGATQFMRTANTNAKLILSAEL